MATTGAKPRDERGPDGALVIAGAEVPPGERRTLELPIADLSNHAPMTMPVQVVHGRRPGPRLLVCAGLHGDEVNGVEIIRRLLCEVTPDGLAGALVAVPVVNVFGFIAMSRYFPDRRDLNRSFPGSRRGSLAARVANAFMGEIVAACGCGIDLHTAAIHRTNLPQIRADLDNERARGLAEAFAPPVIVNANYRDGSLRQAACEMGVPIVVYEGGEALRFDEDAIAAGVEGVRRVMGALGMAPPRPAPPLPPLVARSSNWVRAQASGVMRAAAGPGDRVACGQTLGVVADPFGEREVDVRAPADALVIGCSRLPIVHEGDALFHLVRHEGGQTEPEELDLPDEEPVPPTE